MCLRNMWIVLVEVQIRNTNHSQSVQFIHESTKMMMHDVTKIVQI